MGGRIVGVSVLVVDHGRVQVQELHSTKGWRYPIWVSTKHFAWAPTLGTFSWRGGYGPKPRTDARDAIKPDLMRHGWYRRQMMAEVADADLS